MTENVFEFTDANFTEEVLQSELPVLVDFWAEWCGPCKMLAPTIDIVADEYKDQVKVGKVNVDLNQQLAMQFGIRSIPSLLIFNKGAVAQQLVGAVSKESITKLLDETL